MSLLARADEFCRRFDLRVPVLLAPMAGSSAPSLSIAVMNAGGLGACGAVSMRPDEMIAWAADVRAHASGPFQINTWIPDPPPARDAEHESRVRQFLARFGPPVPPEAGDAVRADFDAQCEAMLEIAPPMVSSVMGIFPPAFVARLEERRITWLANVSTVAEARLAETAGADVIVAQGSEAGGHRGAFDAADGERAAIGLVSLVPAIVDAVKAPVVATGGIADARGVVAALALGASAVQIGTAFLRCPEAKTPRAWADAIGRAAPEDTILTRAFSGRAGRSLANGYAREAASREAPRPAPYPVQRGLTGPMRAAAVKEDDVDRMQAWAGQSAALARDEPAADVVRRIWEGARAMLA
ncbi:MAG TPA: nitronate monooxygenase family protein [Polyangiaceae bacterium]|jgi:nitronate monooxygenase